MTGLAARFEAPVDGGVLRGERHDAEGVPLVLVHGFGGSRRDWDGVIAHLPPSLPRIAYDQRGFGESTAQTGAPFSHAKDLASLLDRLDVDRVDLCGLSLGGATAIGCALQVPDRVRRLVLVSPMLAGWSWTPEWVTAWKAIGQAARAGDIDRARDLWWSHPLFATTRDQPAGALLRESIDSFHGAQWVQDDQSPQLPMVERLHCLQMPVLLLTGAHDLPDFRLMADLIAAAVPHVTRIDHEDAGHLLNLEEPARVASQVAAFLAP